MRPINAFLVVDVQNDFISGSLNISNCAAQQNGIEVSTKEILEYKNYRLERGFEQKTEWAMRID